MNKIKIENIELDSSIQCRATINTDVVTDYADRMREKDGFPPVVLFGDHQQCWIGDGWHRVFAAKEVGLVEIDAELKSGGRVDALKYALGANSLHGQRRSNADKRRAVEIALREFGGLTDSALSEMCGVSDKTVKAARPSTFGNSEPETRTGKDGKEYPATHAPRPPSAKPPPPPKNRVFPKDTKGKEIPNALIPLWNRRDEVKTLINQLNEVKRVLTRGRESSDILFCGGKVGREPYNFQGVEAKLDYIVEELYALYAVRVCPACQGDTCRACCGLGLISSFHLKTIPESIRGK